MSAILSTTGILEHLDAGNLEILSSYGTDHLFKRDEIIIKQGDPQGQLYILAQGKLNVVTNVNGKEVSLAEIQPGECFGEISIFEPGPASATVKAYSDGIIWRLDVDHLQHYLGEYPGEGIILLLGICQLLSRRLRHANAVVKSNQINPGFLSVRARLRLKSSQPIPKVR